MSNHQTGHAAEVRAAHYLEQHGFTIRDRNWKTRYCEIDIVAQKANTIYFVEVKYRRTNSQGYGVDYITPKKLQQMQFAAESWVHQHHWTGDYQLSVVSVDGGHMQFIETITL